MEFAALPVCRQDGRPEDLVDERRSLAEDEDEDDADDAHGDVIVAMTTSRQRVATLAEVLQEAH